MTKKLEGGRLLVLHGNQQTGDLLLGRIDRLTRRLKKEFGVEAIAPDAPFLANPDKADNHLRTWWTRKGDHYVGLEDSLAIVQSIQEESSKPIVGILGFSQGARLGHLLGILHQQHPATWLPNLKFSILVAGYEKPLPPELIPYCNIEDNQSLSVSSLHVWGSNDSLIHKDEFEGLVKRYKDSETYIHPGKHHVPTKGSELPTYINFIQKAISKSSETTTILKEEPIPEVNPIPDEETAELQREEVQALEAIFPGALDLQSNRIFNEDDEEVFDFPIVYRITLNDIREEDDEDEDETDTKNWPKHPLTVQIKYPVNYPSDDPNQSEQTTIPQFDLLHQNTVFEFPSVISAKLVSLLKETAVNELGMPCIMSCLYAARDFLDEDREWDDNINGNPHEEKMEATNEEDETDEKENYESCKEHHPLIRPSSPSEIRQGTLEGLEIAQALMTNNTQSAVTQNSETDSSENDLYRGSGSFGTYTIGLVGKPSAGKSTFFNAATAFSRQRGQHQEAATASSNSEPQDTNDGLGGASMAAHPFTTIDPNVGYCLIPAPEGSCPEDLHAGESFGSTHGRDASGRRFLPVLLKDVAGLVPGAYQGKGRGNQFLNDLTDAAVLIHVVDASGSADASGNKIVVDGGEEANQELTNPLDDLAWIRAELVEWVYSNLVAKWETISRKGRSKLAGMFSGYGQKIDMAETVFPALEKFMEDKYERERALDKIFEWNEADIQRLVSLFLGVRFPMALCLNKHDLPSSKAFIQEVQESLPIHGAHVGTPISAKHEMTFVKDQMTMNTSADSKPPHGVWNCLASAIKLREPILVFPVSDMVTLAPMPSLNKAAIGDPSLPSAGMVRCIEAAGGVSPSCWENGQYCASGNSSDKLRDAILMKPGSTVEDVFLTLKNRGALGGEFVRAEASSGVPGERPKPVSKQEVMSRKNRVIKIMTNKRTQWQNTAPEKTERRRYLSKR